MLRSASLTLLALSIAILCAAQKGKDSIALDTTFTDYDELFSELDLLIDSLTSPRSYTLLNLSVGQSFLTYDQNAFSTDTRRRLTYSPSVGHYNKTGLGIGVGASLLNDGAKLNPYQFSLTGSYDYLNAKAFLTGISLTHFFTKSDLPFYTSPLQNEVYGYFTYRKLWVKPSVGFSYGWGSRENFEQVEERIQNINLAQKGFTRINTAEKIVDLNLIVSLRHDFYFLESLGSDYLRLTPQLTFTSGSQQFGFNQTANTYATVRRSGNNILYNTERVSFDNRFYFQPISLTAFVKAEYAKGKFFFAPQLMLDCYLPATEDRFTPGFLLNTGFAF